jgi:hypothetical protein
VSLIRNSCIESHIKKEILHILLLQTFFYHSVYTTHIISNKSTLRKNLASKYYSKNPQSNKTKMSGYESEENKFVPVSTTLTVPDITFESLAANFFLSRYVADHQDIYH